MEDERLALSLPEAAKLLGCSSGLVYRLARQGKLPTIRLGRRRVVPRQALDSLLPGQAPTTANHSKVKRRS